jgi:NTE family protein
MNDMSVPRLEPPAAQVERLFHGWRPEGCDRVALVLQGGGALGAYQAGVYQALHESGIEPDWVSGVSIGAINAAIIRATCLINVSAACGRSGS